MRKSLFPAALLALLLLMPSMALGSMAVVHFGKGSGSRPALSRDLASSATLRAAAVTCAKYTPAGEKRMRRLEERALGPRHAAEHAHDRALSHRQECTRTGKLKPSFVARVRAAASGSRRIQATGAPSDVGQWSASMHIDVTGIHATLLPTGKVLFFSYGPSETGIAALWDPATGTSHRVDPSTHENIWCGAQTQLADGRVLIVGGNIPKSGTTEFRGLDSIYIFDPSTETWSLQGRMHEGRWYPTATLLPNGQVVITSGLKRDGSGTINTDVDVFTPNPDPTKVGTITTVGQKSFNLYPRTYVIRDGRALVAGPQSGDVGLLNPATWTWSSVPPLKGEHYYGTGVLLPDGPNGSSKVMAIGGDQQAGTEVLDAENLGSGWNSKASLPQSRRNANSVLTPDGAIITIGGNGTDNYDNPRFDALRYDPAADTWTSLAAQVEPRGYHSTAVLLPDARIVSAGDDGPSGGGGQSDEIEVFSPPYLFKGARPSIVSAPGQVSYGASFAIGTPDTDIAKAVLIAPGATTHSNDMHQRLVPLALSPAAGGFTATAPATTGIAPPGYYMLFLVNSNGVPSIAKWVKLSGTTSGNQPPVAVAAATTPVSGVAPLTVSFSSAGSFDPEGGALSFSWDLNGDGTFGDSTVANPQNYVYSSAGTYQVRVRVTDSVPQSTTSSAVTVTVGAAANLPPVAVAAATTSVSGVAPLTVSFSSAGSFDPEGGALSFSWDLNGDGTFGDSTVANPQNYVYSSAGTYQVRVRVTDSVPQSTTSSAVTVTVGAAANLPPVAVAAATTSVSGVAPLTVSFSSAGSSDPEGGALSFSWDLNGDGTFGDSTVANPQNYVYSSAGTYQVRVRVTDSVPQSTTSSAVTVTVTAGGGGATVEKAKGKPASASSTEGAAWAVAASANDGNVATRWSSSFANNQWWQVDLGSATAVSSVNLDFCTWAWPATYTVSTSLNGTTWTVVANEALTSGGSKVKTSTFTQTTARYVRVTGLTRGTSFGTSINEAKVYGPSGGGTNLPPVAVAAATTSVSGAAPLTVSFSSAGSFDPEGGALSFSWDLNGDGTFGDSTVANPQNYVYSSAGTYQVRVRVTDSVPQSTTSSAVTVTVGAAANLPPVAVAAATTPVSGVAPLTVSFSSAGSSDPEGGALSFSWDLNGDGTFGDSTVANPQNYVYSSAGTYQVRVRVTDSVPQSTTSSAVTVTVGAAANLPPVAVAAATTSVSGVAPLTVSFSSAGSFDPEGGALSFSWDLNGDGTFGDSTVANPQNYVYSSAGTYQVRVRVTDSVPQSTTSSAVTVTVGAAANLPPVAVAAATTSVSGVAPLTVSFSSAGSSDPEGGALSFSWDLNGDGTFGDSTVANPQNYVYSSAGTYQVRVRVTDSVPQSTTSSAVTVTVTAGGGGATVEKAKGKPASASSTEGAAWAVAASANDGNVATRWSSSFANNQWWQVDLGSATAVSSVNLDFCTWAWPATYTVSTSLNGTTWTVVANEALTSGGSKVKTSTFTQTTARYVRVTGLTRGTSFGTSINEAKVYGPSG